MGVGGETEKALRKVVLLRGDGDVKEISHPLVSISSVHYV